MICSRCLRTRSAPRVVSLIRSFTSFQPLREPAAATSTNAAQPFSSPHETASLAPKQTSKVAVTEETIIQSIAPAGQVLQHINYIKNQNDPVALKEDEYPAWLWRCLDEKKNEDEDAGQDADLFAKSKKLRRKAAKRQRKLEAARLASGDLSALDVKVPLTKQTIDLPGNEEGTIEGANVAFEKRDELRAALRRERRSKIKENNYLKSV